MQLICARIHCLWLIKHISIHSNEAFIKAINQLIQIKMQAKTRFFFVLQKYQMLIYIYYIRVVAWWNSHFWSSLVNVLVKNLIKYYYENVRIAFECARSKQHWNIHYVHLLSTMMNVVALSILLLILGILCKVHPYSFPIGEWLLSLLFNLMIEHSFHVASCTCSSVP